MDSGSGRETCAEGEGTGLRVAVLCLVAGGREIPALSVVATAEDPPPDRGRLLAQVPRTMVGLDDGRSGLSVRPLGDRDLLLVVVEVYSGFDALVADPPVPRWTEECDATCIEARGEGGTLTLGLPSSLAVDQVVVVSCLVATDGGVVGQSWGFRLG